jgi:hypothetical protein
MPSAELVFLGLIAIAIGGLLSIHRHERRRRDGDQSLQPGVLWPANVRLASIVVVLGAIWFAGNAATTAVSSFRSS